MNNLLCVCIPTYNRANKLDETLKYLIPYCKKYNLPICISDNGSSDNTRSVVQKHQENYSFIQYKLNESNIGCDRNFENVLKMSTSDYSWLLGDDDVILFSEIDFVIDILTTNEPDFLIVNTRNQVTENLPGHYTDKNNLLRDLGWHMSFISSLVFSRQCIEKANFNDFYGTGFVHIGAVFSYLSEIEKINVRWLDKVLVTTLRTDNDFPSWYKQLLLVFGENWLNTIISLPIEYTAETKLLAARNLWKKSSIVSMKALLLLRAYDLLKFSDIKKYHMSISVLTGKKLIFVYIISVIPQILIRKPLSLIFNLYMRKRNKETLETKSRLLK